MKQRLLLSLLMLFVSVGFLKAANIHVTPLGNTAVTIALGSGQAIVTEVEGLVTLSSDKKTVAIAQGYTTPVNIVTPKDETTITFTGSMDDLSINGGDKLKTIGFGSNSYVRSLTVSGKAIASLDCSGLGLENLTLSSDPGLDALTKIDASDNKLTDGGIVGLRKAAKLEELNLSNNLYEGLDLSSLTSLKKLYVADNQLESISLPSQLKNVDLSGNKLKRADIPSGCDETWGTQTIELATEHSATANDGVQVADLIKEAGIVTGDVDKKKISAVSWQVKNGTEYVKDNGTAHDVNGYKWEYRFYNTKDGYVRGDYQCTVTYDNRAYAIQNIQITAAKFTMNVETPANAAKIEVFVDDNATAESDNSKIVVKQTQKVRVVVTPKAGYEDVTYTVKGLVAADGSSAPYKGKSFEFVVKAMYGEEPALSATVAAAGRKVIFENTTQPGGSFTVQKISGHETSEMKSGEAINTGDKLLITILSKSANFTLTVGGKDVSDKVVKTGDDGNYTITIDITEDAYPVGKDIAVVVSFSDEVKVTAMVDGKSITNAPASLSEGKIAITVDGKDVVLDANKASVNVTPGTSYTARFTLAKGYRLQNDVITINGGKFSSLTKTEKEDGSITYTVIFSVEKSDVTLSITTKKISVVEIKPRIDVAPSTQKQVYDGQQKPIIFTTNPAGLESSVEVTYKSEDKSKDYGNVAPTNVGTFSVVLAFKEDGTYMTKDGAKVPVTLEIVPASLTIKTLPTVTVGKDGKYVVTGGEVTFNDETIAGTWALEGNKTEPDEAGKSHNIGVTFTPTSTTDKANFEAAKATVYVQVGDDVPEMYTVGMETLPAGYSVKWYNGNKEVKIDTDKFIAGTELTAVVTYPKGTKEITFDKTSSNVATIIGTPTVEDGCSTYKVTLRDNTIFKVVAGVGNAYKISFKEDNNNDYTGEPQEYEFDKFITITDKDGNNVAWSTVKDKATIVYKTGTTEVPRPIDADEYSVTVTIAADAENGYIESSATGTDVFEIVPIKATVSKWPEASVIAKGMPLSQSDLTNGVANVEGRFCWVDEDITPKTSGEHTYDVVFNPSEEYAKNYTSVTKEKGVTVVVSDLQIVAFSQPAEASIEVSKNGTVTKPGAPVVNGDKLTITVTPKTDWEVTSITVNGKSCSFTQSNGKYVATYLVGDVSAAIEATFKAKSTEVIDPNSQYKVTVTESVRGAIISHPGENVVKRGESFTFTVSTLAADAGKVDVEASAGTIKKGSNGSYTLSDVKANTTITVSLSNPTPLKVEVQKDYLNANKYHIGQVEIIDGEATTYYYGDVITVMADPEDGVKFVKWSDGSTDKIHEITLKADTKVVASFSGVPTGIEDIESAAITTGKGFIMVKNVANAKVTVVSISGRLQAQEEVSGDTRIDVPQGIYVVVLESGSDVKRTKVIVK